MKLIFLKLFIFIVLKTILSSTESMGQLKSFYELKANTIDGKLFEFSQLRGKKVLIINTSTGCTLAPQFKKLQELYLKYEKSNFEIIAFPSNDYGKQEQNNNQSIKKICKDKYDITFHLMEKISIRENTHPVYKWLTLKEENGFKNIKIIWNFQKFLIDENGHLVDFMKPIVSPTNEKIISWIENKADY